MKVHNPTENTLRVKVEGTEYEVHSGETIEGVNKDHAHYWQRKLHSFIELTPEKVDEGEITDPEAVEKKKADDMINDIIGLDEGAKRRNKLEAIAEAAGIDPEDFEDDEELAAAIRKANSDEEEEADDEDDNEDEE